MSLQEYYAARAPEYDRVYHKPERQHDLRAIEQWVREQFVGARVLEIACGTGYWTQFIAIARSRATRDNVIFEFGDAYAPGRNARGHDAAFAGFWLSHVPVARRGDFLCALHAALEPGAKVVMLDNLFVAGSSSAISERDADGNTYQIRQLSDGTKHRVLKNFPSRSELLSLAQRSGHRATVIRWQYYWAMQYFTDAGRGHSIGGSSKGRTSDFDSGNRGSNPRPPTTRGHRVR